MKVGFLIPTTVESVGIPEACTVAAGFGAGKSSSCAAAADLVFNRRCDTVVIWGTAGCLSNTLQAGDIVVATRTAHKDFSLEPLFGARGLGDVPGFSGEDFWHAMDKPLAELLLESVKRVFPDRHAVPGAVCSGDIFDPAKAQGNPIEAQADAVDMETSAVAEFCHRLREKCGMSIRFGTIRVLSNDARAVPSANAASDFSHFMELFSQMNTRLLALQQTIEGFRA
jgi:nucleoside phosphorylase